MSLKNKPSIPLLIAALPFVKMVDLMLLEGTPAMDVAKYIQVDQKALIELRTESLAKSLLRRRESLRQGVMTRSEDDTKRWFNTAGGADDEFDDEDDGEEPEAEASGSPMPGGRVGEPDQLYPSAIARKLYERVIERGVDELVELEALYLSQRQRIDRLYRMEAPGTGYIENLNREFKVGMDMLLARMEIKKTLGLTDGDQKFREQLNIKGYSEKTQKTLSNPESRHRVVSLVEKLTRMEEKKRKKEQEKASSEG